MKNLKISLMAIVLVITAFGSFGLVAQTTGSNTNENSQTEASLSQDDIYTVQAGDSLYKLDPAKWPEVEAMNSFLVGRKTVREDGFIRVLIYPGEQLRGVKTLGLQILNAGTVVGTPTPTATPTPSPTPAGSAVAGSSFWSFDPTTLLSLLALALAALVAYLIFMNWFKSNRGNAANAGPRFEQRPLNNQTAADAFRRQYNTGNSEPDFTVRNLRSRLASGAINVAYSNGTTQTRVLDRELVYLADLHYPNNRIERDVMLLSACGNPLRRGGNVLSYAPGLNFRFVDEGPRFIPIPTEAEQAEAANANQPTANPTSVVFDGENASVTTNGQTVEMVTTGDTQFSHLQSTEEGKTTAVQVETNGVLLTFRDGKIESAERTEYPILRVVTMFLGPSSEEQSTDEGTADDTAPAASEEKSPMSDVKYDGGH